VSVKTRAGGNQSGCLFVGGPRDSAKRRLAAALALMTRAREGIVSSGEPSLATVCRLCHDEARGG
jgi:hypothetical protein